MRSLGRIPVRLAAPERHTRSLPACLGLGPMCRCALALARPGSPSLAGRAARSRSCWGLACSYCTGLQLLHWLQRDCTARGPWSMHGMFARAARGARGPVVVSSGDRGRLTD